MRSMRRELRLCPGYFRLLACPDAQTNCRLAHAPPLRSLLRWSSRGSTHFGFRTVPADEKERLVGHVFESVSSRYDLMNDVMSVGIHRVWKDMFVAMIGVREMQLRELQVLDVAGGTGDIAFRIVREMERASGGGAAGSAKAPPSQSTPSHTASSASAAAAEGDDGVEDAGGRSRAPARAGTGAEVGAGAGSGSGTGAGGESVPGAEAAAGTGDLEPRVVVCDINKAMLEEGRKRAATLGLGRGSGSAPRIEWVTGDAEQLPFDDCSFDVYTIAFGIRNVTHIERALSEAHRVLRPGGRFLCLEFSRVTNPLLRTLYERYSFDVIPRLGGVFADDRDSYQYLVESIRRFPDQEAFAQLVSNSGLRSVQHTNLTNGIVAVHSAVKLPHGP